MNLPRWLTRKHQTHSPTPSQTLTAKDNIALLDMQFRAYHCLSKAGIESISDLLKRTENDLLTIPNFGVSSLRSVRIALRQAGFPDLAITRTRRGMPRL